MNDVKEFLSEFHSSNNIDDIFASKCCYWFAFILFRRFIREGATIVYDRAKKHFGTRIKGAVFDITGDVTEQYNWTEWTNLADDTYKKRIIQDYIMF